MHNWRYTWVFLLPLRRSRAQDLQRRSMGLYKTWDCVSTNTFEWWSRRSDDLQRIHSLDAKWSFHQGNENRTSDRQGKEEEEEEEENSSVCQLRRMKVSCRNSSFLFFDLNLNLLIIKDFHRENWLTLFCPSRWNLCRREWKEHFSMQRWCNSSRSTSKSFSSDWHRDARGCVLHSSSFSRLFQLGRSSGEENEGVNTIGVRRKRSVHQRRLWSILKRGLFFFVVFQPMEIRDETRCEMGKRFIRSFDSCFGQWRNSFELCNTSRFIDEKKRFS